MVLPVPTEQRNGNKNHHCATCVRVYSAQQSIYTTAIAHMRCGPVYLCVFVYIFKRAALFCRAFRIQTDTREHPTHKRPSFCDCSFALAEENTKSAAAQRLQNNIDNNRKNQCKCKAGKLCYVERAWWTFSPDLSASSAQPLNQYNKYNKLRKIPTR